MISEHSLQILNALPEAILIVSTEGMILAANTQVKSLGLDPAELPGRQLGDLAETNQGGVAELLRTYARSGSPLPGVITFHVRPEVVVRSYGSLMVPPQTDQPGELMLRFVPQRESLRRFQALNEKIEELTQENQRRRASEAELERQRRQLQTTLASIGDAVIVTDAQGNVRMLNGVAEALTGWDCAAAEGKPLIEIFHIINERTRQQVENPVEKVFATGVIVGLANHTILIARDGTERPIDDSAAPIKDADGSMRGVVLIFRDISEQHLWQRQLEESEERFRQLAESVDDVFYVRTIDPPTMLYINPAYEETWGRSCEELIAEPHSFIDSIHPEDQYRIREALEVQRTGEATITEYRIITPEGDLKWIRDRGFPIADGNEKIARVAGLAEDITQRKQTDRDVSFLAEASRSLAGLIDYQSTLQVIAHLAVPNFADWCGIDVVDDAGQLQPLAVAHVDPMKVELATRLRREYPPNPEATIGAPRVVRTGQPEMLSEIPPEFLEKAARDPEHLNLLRQLGLKSYMCVPLMIREQLFGVMTFVSAESSRRYTESNLGIAQDLAHRASIAIENARLYTDLKEADRRKDEFLAMLAHELRNPLAPIRSGLDVLRLGHNRPEILDLMGRQVDHLVRLVEDLLDVSRILRGKVELRQEVVELSLLLERALETIRGQVESEGQQIACSLPAKKLLIHGDPVRLAQVFYNLLSNASKYGKKNGIIRIEAQVEEDSVEISFRDDGIGIDPEFLPRIFDLFTQAERTIDRSQGGLGIGLTVVKNLVDLHQGTVSVHSEGSGKGSEFRVTLPLVVEDRPTESKLAKSSQTPPLRILVVDDNVGAAKMLSILLTTIGSHEVQMVHDGAAALEAAKAFRPEFIFLDIGLPRMNGYEVARRLRSMSELNSFALVALTGYGTPEDKLKSHDAGFDVHMVKPPSIDDLQQVLRQKSL
ncbi:MAG: PAS domain S-box protein [Pirellulaceae bacterium]